MVSKDVQDLFPHKTIRPAQKELIEDIETAFEENKILLAHAPTGLGKTASALSVAIAQAQKHNKKVFFLTNRHTQHQIAVKTLQLIKEKTGNNISCVDLIGKRWMCNQEVAGLFGNDFNEYCKTVVEKGECEFYNKVKTKKDLTVEAKAFVSELHSAKPMHNEELISLSKEKSMCSYEISLALAKKATVFIGDYYYLFNPYVQSTLFQKLELVMEDIIVVVDEGHNLPSRVMDMLSSNLTSNMLKNAVVEAKKFHYNGLIVWIQELMRILNDLTNSSQFQKEKESLIQRENFMDEVRAIVNYDTLIDELELAADEVRKKQRKSYLGGISSFLTAWREEETGFSRILAEQPSSQGSMLVLSYSCLDPSIATKDIFSKVHQGIVMSGTLNPTFMYKDLLGIQQGITKEYPSPFPPENKLSLILPQTSTKYSVRNDSMYQRIAGYTQHMASLIPGNVAIFFPSYYVRDKVSYFIKSEKKLFFEKQSMTKEEKELFLHQFKQHKAQGGVLLAVTGANFAEGVDFPGDLLNGVVVVGLPLAKPSLKTKEIIRYYDTKFNKGWDYGYIYPAMSKCFQSAGRCIRSETDKGAVIYLDERFAWKNYYDCFPREGLIVSKDYEKLISQFFR